MSVKNLAAHEMCTKDREHRTRDEQIKNLWRKYSEVGSGHVVVSPSTRKRDFIRQIGSRCTSPEPFDDTLRGLEKVGENSLSPYEVVVEFKGHMTTHNSRRLDLGEISCP